MAKGIVRICVRLSLPKQEAKGSVFTVLVRETLENLDVVLSLGRWTVTISFQAIILWRRSTILLPIAVFYL
jgi:hypothetical protein